MLFLIVLFPLSVFHCLRPFLHIVYGSAHTGAVIINASLAMHIRRYTTPSTTTFPVSSIASTTPSINSNIYRPAFCVRFGHLTCIVCYSDTQNTVALCKSCIIFQHINNICINRAPCVLTVLKFQHFKAVALFVASVIFPQLKALFPAYYVLVIRCHYFYLMLFMLCVSLAWQMLHFFCVCPLL